MAGEVARDAFGQRRDVRCARQQQWQVQQAGHRQLYVHIHAEQQSRQFLGRAAVIAGQPEGLRQGEVLIERQ